MMSRRIFHLPCHLHPTWLLSRLLFALSLLRLPCLALVVRLLIIPGNALLLADQSLLQKCRGHPLRTDKCDRFSRKCLRFCDTMFWDGERDEGVLSIRPVKPLA